MPRTITVVEKYVTFKILGKKKTNVIRALYMYMYAILSISMIAAQFKPLVFQEIFVGILET